jgi:hypothetical protein
MKSRIDALWVETEFEHAPAITGNPDQFESRIAQRGFLDQRSAAGLP